MNESIKQAMHLDACKSFGAAEANENERRWDDKMIDSKNNDSINNYDKTRMRLNFEIGPHYCPVKAGKSVFEIVET